MTYNRQMEKAIKEYLTPLGFKYSAKEYAFFKAINDDITLSIGWAAESRFESQYYYLKITVGASSNILNSIIYDVTDGLEDFRHFLGTPAYVLELNEHDQFHIEFTGKRPMEENIAGFDKLFNDKMSQVFERYKTTKSICLAPIHEPYFNRYKTPYVWFYVPLAYYLNGEYDKAFEFIDKRIEIEFKGERMVLERFGSLCDEDTKDRRAYIIYKENLKKWIAEG